MVFYVLILTGSVVLLSIYQRKLKRSCTEGTDRRVFHQDLEEYTTSLVSYITFFVNVTINRLLQGILNPETLDE